MFGVSSTVAVADLLLAIALSPFNWVVRGVGDTNNRGLFVTDLEAFVLLARRPFRNEGHLQQLGTRSPRPLPDHIGVHPTHSQDHHQTPLDYPVFRHHCHCLRLVISAHVP